MLSHHEITISHVLKIPEQQLPHQDISNAIQNCHKDWYGNITKSEITKLIKRIMKSDHHIKALQKYCDDFEYSTIEHSKF